MPLILSEIDGTVFVTDMRDFHALSEQLGPIELGVVLGSYYEHIAGAVERHGGRVVKFVGDGVLAMYAGPGHRDKGLATLRDLAAAKDGWLADNAKVQLPVMDYAAGVATGPILCGELGTDRVRFYDVIGAPVNRAFSLCALALRRGLPNLLDEETVSGAASAAACVELPSEPSDEPSRRLFRA